MPSPTIGRSDIRLPTRNCGKALGEPFTSNDTVGWKLGNFVADLVIECEEGYIADSPEDEGLGYVV